MVKAVAAKAESSAWSSMPLPNLRGLGGLESAYRQIPLMPSHVSLSITAQLNPATGKVEFFELYGNPFGAAHSVPHFYAAAEWVARVSRRLLLISEDHFFDDYFLVEPQFSIHSAA